MWLRKTKDESSVEQMTLGVYEILRGGGFTSVGMNFDAKLRRQSIARDDLFHGHIGGMDTMARSLLAAAAMLDDGVIEDVRRSRYQGWDGDLGQRVMSGNVSLADLRAQELDRTEPLLPSSGRQELLENTVAKYVERAR